MFKLNLCVKSAPEESGEYYLVLFDNVPNSYGMCPSKIYNEKSQRVYSFDNADYVLLVQKLCEQIKLLGNIVKCVDKPESLNHDLVKFLVQKINEDKIDEVISSLQLVRKHSVL